MKTNLLLTQFRKERHKISEPGVNKVSQQTHGVNERSAFTIHMNKKQGVMTMIMIWLLQLLLLLVCLLLLALLRTLGDDV